MPPGGIPFGHFVLHRRLARGGMAEVFLARQRGLEGFDRRVAVKRILPHLSERPDFVAMFLDEARLAARLSHPNVVHIYEFGKVDDDYFIAMEYVDGVHAGQLFARGRDEPIPPVLVARIGADAASALAYAHRLEDVDGTPLHVVHRDISPANLMVSYDGVVKLVDFGIAKAAAKAEHTEPGVVKGKFAYMSPEQTVGRPLDGRSDVFSLAIVLWELLAGRHLVDRKDPVEAMRALRDGRFPAIEEVAPAVPFPLAAALGRALEVDREERSTAAELGVALEAFIKASPELATAIQLAEHVHARFPRAPSTSGAHAALPGAVGARPRAGTAVATPTGGAPAGTQVATPTGAAAGTQVATPTGGAQAGTAVAPATGASARALALPPRDATILHRPLQERTAAPDAVPDADPGFDDQLTSEVGIEPTAIVFTPGSRVEALAPPAARRRAAWPWLVVFAGATAGIAALALALRGGAPERADASAADGTAARAAAADAGAEPEPEPAAAPDAALAAAPEPDAGPRLASLDVVTTPPGATVRLEGREAPVERAPARFAELDPGEVDLHVELAGHEPIDRTLTLAPGERRTLDLVLVPIPRDAGGRATDRATGRTGGRATGRTGGRTTGGDRAPATGTLNVRTTPYSVVHDGRRRLGETPFVRDLPAGTYTLTFEHPGRPAQTRKVTIRAGETTKLNFAL